MTSWWADRPLAIAAVILFAIVFCRAQATYWLGRAAVAGAVRTRWSAWIDGEKVRRATARINRYGPPVVTVSFLTIGFQTVANAAAGLTRMPFPRYLLAMVPGCLAWALIYATVGMAVVNGAVLLAVRSPWVLVGLGGLVVVGSVWWVARRRRAAAASAPRPEPR